MTSTTDRVLLAAAAIANARGMRRGVPTITNILDILPDKLREEVMEDAEAALTAAGWQTERKRIVAWLIEQADHSGDFCHDLVQSLARRIESGEATK